MFGIGPWELLIVFAIVLLLFGGKRLPGIATGLGSAIRNFKSSMKEPEVEIDEIAAKRITNKDAQTVLQEDKTSTNMHS